MDTFWQEPFLFKAIIISIIACFFMGSYFILSLMFPELIFWQRPDRRALLIKLAHSELTKLDEANLQSYARVFAHDTRIMRKLIEIDASLIQFAEAPLKDNFKNAMLALETYPQVYENLSYRLKSDKRIIYKALGIPLEGSIPRYVGKDDVEKNFLLIPEEWKHNDEVLRYVLPKYPMALEFASDTLKADSALMYKVLKADPEAIQFASDLYKSDDYLILNILERYKHKTGLYREVNAILKHVKLNVFKKKEFLKKALKLNYEILYCIPDEAIEDFYEEILIILKWDLFFCVEKEDRTSVEYKKLKYIETLCNKGFRYKIDFRNDLAYHWKTYESFVAKFDEKYQYRVIDGEMPYATYYFYGFMDHVFRYASLAELEKIKKNFESWSQSSFSFDKNHKEKMIHLINHEFDRRKMLEINLNSNGKESELSHASKPSRKNRFIPLKMETLITGN
jgi:hypothetical protein